MKINDSQASLLAEQHDQTIKSPPKTPEKAIKNKQKNYYYQNSERSSGFWLTQAQKIYIQHKLPNLFSLVLAPHAGSRLIMGSKILQEQSVQFSNRKRGRPEGSFRKITSVSPANERKSIRIRIKKSQNSRKQSEESDSQNNSLDSNQIQSVSLAKDLQFSRSASKMELKSQKSKTSRQNLYIKEEIQQKTQLKSTKTIKIKIGSQGNIQLSSPLKEKAGKEQQKYKDSPLLDKKDTKQQKNISQDILKSTIKNNVIQQLLLIKTSQQQKMERNDQVNSSMHIASDKFHNKLFQIPSLQAYQQLVNSQSRAKQQPSIITVKPAKQTFEEQLQSKLIQQKFGPQINILRKLKLHPQILPFLQPVDELRDNAPDYYSIIADPIDLQTIEFKLANNIYSQPCDFHIDIQRMWTNARLYNTDNPFMLRVTTNIEKLYLKLSKITAQKPGKQACVRAKRQTKQGCG